MDRHPAILLLEELPMRGGFGKGMFRFSSGKGYGNHGHNSASRDIGTILDTGEFRSVLFSTMASCAKPRNKDAPVIKDPNEIIPGVRATEAINIAMLGCVFFFAMLMVIGGCFVIGWISDMKQNAAIHAQPHPVVSASGKTPGPYQQQYVAQQAARHRQYLAQQQMIGQHTQQVQQMPYQQYYAAPAILPHPHGYAANPGTVHRQQMPLQQHHGQYYGNSTQMHHPASGTYMQPTPQSFGQPRRAIRY
jgi:hypothetical protein